MRHTLFTVKVTASDHCPDCQGERPIYRRRLDHATHFLYTTISLGAWAPAWLVLWYASWQQPWRCKHCRCRIERTGPVTARRALRQVAVAGK